MTASRSPSGLRAYFDVSNPRHIWLITIAHGVNEFYSVALPPILPLLVTDFDISYAEAGALLTVFFVMYSVFQLPAGFLADRFGKRRLLSLGMVVLAVGLLVAGIARDYSTLVIAQVIAGIGGSTYHPTGMSLISDVETTTTEGRAMGIHGFGGVVGTALAPALIGGLAVAFDWRIALTAGASVGVVYAVAFTVLFDETILSDEPASRSAVESNSDDGAWPIGGDRDSIIELFHVPLTWWVAGLFVVNFLVSLEVGAARTFTTSYLFVRLSESTTLANGGFFLMLVGGGISSLWAGHLADRFDRTYVGVATLLVAAVLFAITYVIPENMILLAWFFVLGAAVYATMPAVNALTSAYSEREFSGSLFGIMLSAASLGGAAGPLAFGIVANRVGMAIAFPMIAIVSVVAAVAFIVMLRV